MALFVMFEIHNYTQILIRTFLKLFLLLVGLPGLSCVFTHSWDGAFLTFSVLLTLFLLLLFSSFLGGLIRALETWGEALGASQWSSGLRFFHSEIFHSAILAFGNSEVGWSVATRTILIHFLSEVGEPTWPRRQYSPWVSGQSSLVRGLGILT